MTSKSGLYYGWVIVAVAFLVAMVVYGTRHSFSMFFVAILDEFHWSRGATALMLSINIMVYGLAAPVAGIVADRFGVRRTVPAGAILLGLSMAALSRADQLWHFYVVFGILVPLCMGLVGFPALAPMIANWFQHRRATAFAVFQAGLGLSFVVGSLAEYFIVNLGWRAAYIAVGVLIVIVVVPLALLFLHFRPSDKGLAVDGGSRQPERASGGTVVETVDVRWKSTDWTPARAIKTRRFWLLFAAGFLMWGPGIYTVFGHQMAALVDSGFDRLFAAMITGTLFGVANGIGHGCGFLSDRLGRERTYTVGALGAACAMLILIVVNPRSPALLIYLYPFLLGVLGGMVAPSQTAIYADLFHGKHFGAVNGLLMMGFGLGAAIGPWFGGFIHDTTGSYTIAFAVSAASCMIAMALVWMAAPRRVVRVRRLMKEPYASGAQRR